MQSKPESRWSLTHAGNRVLWSVVVAWIAWSVTQSVAIGAGAGIVLLLLLTALMARRR